MGHLPKDVAGLENPVSAAIDQARYAPEDAQYHGIWFPSHVCHGEALGEVPGVVELRFDHDLAGGIKVAPFLSEKIEIVRARIRNR